jgi:hypothetical protein
LLFHHSLSEPNHRRSRKKQRPPSSIPSAVQGVVAVVNGDHPRIAHFRNHQQSTNPGHSLRSIASALSDSIALKQLATIRTVWKVKQKASQRFAHFVRYLLRVA